MAKYVLKFSKEGYFKYTSHLDLLRLFKRGFKRVGIQLDYSQGFNPHPKMSFAQPLSLGYSSIAELLEFETGQDIKAEDIRDKFIKIMPEGLKILGCTEYEDDGKGKTLAALATKAEYLIGMPFGIEALNGMGSHEACEAFLAQEHIIVKKRQKKTKEFADLDIKSKIINLVFTEVDEKIIITALLDAGSESNLSPELLIDAILKFLNVNISRYDIDVMRKKIIFSNNFTM